jgi:hypothetical protein
VGERYTAWSSSVLRSVSSRSLAAATETVGEGAMATGLGIGLDRKGMSQTQSD